MLKKSLLLASCLMVGVVLSSGSYAGTGSTEAAIDRSSNPPRKACSPKNKLPKDSSQPSILAWLNPSRLWALKMKEAAEKYEKAEKIAYAKKKAQEREDAESMDS
jgi:hypothetical protein